MDILVPPSTNGRAAAAAGPKASRLPDVLPAVRPPRKLDLAPAAMPVAGDLQPVAQLVVQELKGVGQMFTANLDIAYQFRGVVYKPAGSFETLYQLVAGDALRDPRVAPMAKYIAFVPVFSWASFEVVLHPVRMTSYGQRTLSALRKLQGEFPNYKCFVSWEEVRRRHVVRHDSLSPAEAELIGAVEWPDREAIIDALEPVAYETADELAADNEEVRALLSMKEVE